MKMVPNPATKIWQEDGRLHGEWSDRVLGDEDRYAHDSVFLVADVPITGDDNANLIALNIALVHEFDKWVKATR